MGQNGTEKTIVELWTDGSTKTNPGIGGYGYLFIDSRGGETLGCKGFKKTTNNRMELLGMIEPLEWASKNLAFNNDNVLIKVFSDSNYCVQAANSWIENWKKKGWRSSTGDVKNRDLMIRLDDVKTLLNLEFNWVKGHANIINNERVDRLAKQGTNENILHDDEGFEE